MAAARETNQSAIRRFLDQATKSANTADEAIEFSDDAAQAAVHELTNAVRSLASAVRRLLPWAGGAR